MEVLIIRYMEFCEILMILLTDYRVVEDNHI